MANPNWKKGVSGNPGGRPKAALDVQALARTHTAEAIKTLVAAMKDPKTSVPAAVALLERGWGKPVQHNTNETTVTVKDERDAIKREIAELVAPAIARNGTGLVH